MAAGYLSATPRGASEFVVESGVVGVDTGMACLVKDLKWGDVVWTPQMAGPRGSQGARAASASVGPRTGQVPIRVFGATKDQLAQRVQALFTVVDQLRRLGGKVTWRSAGQTYRQHFDVLACSLTGEWGRQAESTQTAAEFLLTIIAGPYALGDPMDVLDEFNVDSIASGAWTVDQKTASPTINGGTLTPGDTNLLRLRLTQPGYPTTDTEATVDMTTGAAVANLDDTITICADTTGADTHLGARLAGSGVGTSPNTLAVVKRVAGTLTVLASTAFTPATTTRYFVRTRREGPRVFAEIFTYPLLPTPLGAPTASVSYTLTAAEQATHNRGHAGLRLLPGATTETYTSYEQRPYTYRAWNLPDELRLCGPIPGDASALFDFHLTASGSGTGGGGSTGSGGAAQPVWLGFGWWQRPLIANWCWNGHLEENNSNWSALGITGVQSGGTSALRNTTAARNKYGAANLEIITPATTACGAAFLSFRRYKQGRTYLALAWVSSAAGTTLVRVSLGVNGDITAGTSAALTTTPTLRSVVWQPSADREAAYLSIQTAAATATTFSADGVILCEPLVTTLAANITSTGQATFQVTSQPDDLPTGPFWAMIDNEWLLVTDASTTTWTTGLAGRGAEATTAATHTAGAPIYILPTLRPHLEGRGAFSVFGILPGPNADVLASGSLTVSPDANTRTGSIIGATASGAASAAAEWYIDPALVAADDYTQLEVDIAVYARHSLAGIFVVPTASLGALPAGTATTDYTLLRYTEFGAARYLWKPGDTNVDYRLSFLGGLRLPADRTNPTRWRLRSNLAWQVGSTGTGGIDYHVVVPRRAWARMAERKTVASGYPLCFDAACGAGTETTRIFQAGGGAMIGRPPQAPTQHHSIGGEPLEMPAGATVEMVVLPHSMVPDDPTTTLVDTAWAVHSMSVHAAVTPRFGVIRGS